MRKTILLMAVLVFASGCAALQDPRVQYVAASEAYAAVCTQLRPRIEAGEFSYTELADIDLLLVAADQFLDVWETHLKAGLAPPAAESQRFAERLAELQAYARKEPDDGQE